jgi:hypothetical protein
MGDMILIVSPCAAIRDSPQSDTFTVSLSHGRDGDCPKNYGACILARRFATVNLSPQPKCKEALETLH